VGFKVGNEYGPRFEPGHSGRPRGAKNKLASRVLADMLASWNEPSPTPGLTRGQAALKLMAADDPKTYVKIYTSIMPKEFWLDHSGVSEASDEQLDQAIQDLLDRAKQRLAAQEKKQIVDVTPTKVLTHAER
jgi:hypothetical protein